MNKGKEKRKYKRIKKPFMVRFQIKPHGSGDAEWNMVAVLNLGAGGVLFYYNKEVGLDSLLDIRIDFSTVKTPVNCVGRVIRVEELGYSQIFLTALVFTDIADKDRDMINRIAEEFHSKKEESGES